MECGHAAMPSALACTSSKSRQVSLRRVERPYRRPLAEADLVHFEAAGDDVMVQGMDLRGHGRDLGGSFLGFGGSPTGPLEKSHTRRRRGAPRTLAQAAASIPRIRRCR